MVPKNSSRLIYRLGSSIYIPLTSRCNGRTLPQLRGEGFVLPADVVTALCNVRAIEQSSDNCVEKKEERNVESTAKLQQMDSSTKMKLPPPHFDSVPSLYTNSLNSAREPTVDHLFQEILQECRLASDSDDMNDGRAPQTSAISSIVISGEGEPTLRLDDMMELVRKIRSIADAPKIRLTTNGLVGPNPEKTSGTTLPQQLWNTGVSHLSVGIMTWSGQQYQDLVLPVLDAGPAANRPYAAFDQVCEFIRAACQVDGDLEVEVTAVDRPDVDKDKTEALALSLGVTNPVRWRPYFP